MENIYEEQIEMKLEDETFGGGSVSASYCTYCGSETTHCVNFCKNCGKRI